MKIRPLPEDTEAKCSALGADPDDPELRKCAWGGPEWLDFIRPKANPGAECGKFSGKMMTDVVRNLGSLYQMIHVSSTKKYGIFFREFTA